jgi:hypothetical protein
MSKNSMTEAAPLFAGEAWFDPIEAELRERVRGFLEEMVEQEATAPWAVPVTSRVWIEATGTAGSRVGCLACIARGLRSPQIPDHRRRRGAGEGACRAVA